jgi:NADH dehydrogenase
MKRTRVLILGGGFGGLYAALEFEKRRDPEFEVTLISQENFFLFTPMLHEVAASDLDVTHIVNPIRKILRNHVRFFEGEVQSVNLAEHRVVVAHGFDRHTHFIECDHIVFGLGCVTNFYDIPALQGRAVTMKSLGDAIVLREACKQTFQRWLAVAKISQRENSNDKSQKHRSRKSAVFMEYMRINLLLLLYD